MNSADENSRHSCRDSNPHPFDQESGAQPTGYLGSHDLHVFKDPRCGDADEEVGGGVRWGSPLLGIPSCQFFFSRVDLYICVLCLLPGVLSVWFLTSGYIQFHFFPNLVQIQRFSILNYDLGFYLWFGNIVFLFFFREMRDLRGWLSVEYPVTDNGFFVACEALGWWFDDSFFVCAFFFLKRRSARAH